MAEHQENTNDASIFLYVSQLDDIIKYLFERV